VRRWLCLGAVLLAGGGPPVRAEAVVAPVLDSRRATQAEALYGDAIVRLRTETIEDRRMAITDLETATRLNPDEPRYQIALARAYYRAGFLSNARKRYERVGQLVPGDFDSHMGMGMVWRRDWLKYLDEASLGLAIQHFDSAAATRPGDAEPWLQLVPLHVERHELDEAMRCAERALAAGGSRPETRLAVAYVAYRLGDVERAGRDFSASIPFLPRLARERFEDIAPVASEQDTITLHRLSADGQAAFIDRFWREHDPDLTTLENEAQLEYWSRVAQAYFLFFNAHREEWDERGEVYVRYGPPERAEYNPLGQRLSVSYGAYGNYPANILVWEYPSLGMNVTMQDRLLSEHYMLPITLTHDPDPQPDTDRIDGSDSLLATRGGRGVFPTLPPGVKKLPVESVIARFEGGTSPRLLAQIEAAGEPGDEFTATWVVVDSSQTERLRETRTLSASACDPTALRVGDFAGELPPGTYVVGLSVHDQSHGRGVVRRDLTLVAPQPRLELSDILVSCGPPIAGDGQSVRPEPNPAARVRARDPLTAYFEIYHLRPGKDGLSRFEYVYTVESAEIDERPWLQRMLAPRPKPDPITVSRSESQVGDLRRQFVTVPLGALPPGRYRLGVRVRDELTGVVAAAHVEFERLAP
jgi:GWxTD domain-containing protein